VRGPHRGRPGRCRAAGCAAPRADRPRGRARPGAQGPHTDHREPPRPCPGGGRGGRLQCGDHRTGPAAREPRRQRGRHPLGTQGCPGRRCGCADHRHHGPGLAHRADRRRDRVGGAVGAARLRRSPRPARQRVAGDRDRGRRRDRRGGRPGERQADRGPGGCRARPAAARRRLHRRGTGSARRRGPVLAGHRRVGRTRAPAGPAAAALGAQLQPDAGAAGADRVRRRRGADRTRAAPHPTGPLRLADRPRTPCRAAGPDAAVLAFRPGRRRTATRIHRPAGGTGADSLRRPRGGGPVPGARGRAPLSRPGPHRRRAHHVHGGGRRRGAGPAGGAIGYADQPPPPREPAPAGDLLVRR